MKKILILLLSVLVFNSAKAQESRVAIGVETGLSLTGLMIVPVHDSFRASMLEYNGGLSVLYTISDHITFRSGFFYMGDYGSYKLADYYAEQNELIASYAVYNGKSINIPIGIRAVYGRHIRFFVEGGLIPGYEYRSEIKRIGSTISTETYLIADDTNSSVSESLRKPFFRTLIDLRVGCDFQLSKRLMLETGIGMYMTTRQFDLSADPDLISGKTELPLHISLYYKI